MPIVKIHNQERSFLSTEVEFIHPALRVAETFVKYRKSFLKKTMTGNCDWFQSMWRTACASVAEHFLLLYAQKMN